MPPRPDATVGPRALVRRGLPPGRGDPRAAPRRRASSQRLGLIRSRLRARLQARGIPSFTWFHEHHSRHARRPGDAAADRPEHGQPHDVLPRADPVQPSPADLAGLIRPAPDRRAGPGLVGGLLGRAGALQPGDGAGRDAAGPLADDGRDLGDATSRWGSLRSAARAIYDARDGRGSLPRGSAGSSCAAGGRGRARSGSSRRSAGLVDVPAPGPPQARLAAAGRLRRRSSAATWRSTSPRRSASSCSTASPAPPAGGLAGRWATARSCPSGPGLVAEDRRRRSSGGCRRRS